MTDENPVELAEEAVALRLIADALYGRSKDLSTRAAAAMGRGTLYPKLADGTELAQFTVTADAITVSVDDAQLLPWVREHYPTETVEVVRPAFVEKVRVTSREAGSPCGPGGEVDVPGVSVGWTVKAPTIKAKPEGKARAAASLDEWLANVLWSFAALKSTEGEGGTYGAQD